MNLFGSMITQLERGLDYSATKGKTISQNIANIDTPNYKAKNVSFKEVFANVQGNSLETYKTDERHMNFKSNGTSPGVFNYSNLRYRQDGNGVDMDKEQADLAANQIYYNAVVDRINGKFNTLQNVIKGGR
ncbi:flagellar basal body rod protein FlgB [Sporosarcina sp. E16_3]|uniref:flagellar basal body rod protein FlgB n=1 Tax=unclassified Sporosarcina TaxID=2647733 RepID=UPI0016475613|nr:MULTISPECIES: flagellar basal body rod protein FlgB [unclassified Sporosarcina]MBO0603025.1 flagellar basal body rod protein FlgB [Sporosarcina sp. E16_3]